MVLKDRKMEKYINTSPLWKSYKTPSCEREKGREKGREREGEREAEKGVSSYFREKKMMSPE